MFASLLLALAASAAAAPAPRAASSYSLQWSVKEDGDYVHVSTGARHGRFHGTSNFENGRPVDL